jgi:hypothetical protein
MIPPLAALGWDDNRGCWPGTNLLYDSNQSMVDGHALKCYHLS